VQTSCKKPAFQLQPGLNTPDPANQVLQVNLKTTGMWVATKISRAVALSALALSAVKYIFKSD